MFAGGSETSRLRQTELYRTPLFISEYANRRKAFWSHDASREASLEPCVVYSVDKENSAKFLTIEDALASIRSALP